MKKTLTASNMTVSQIVTAVRNLFNRNKNLEEVTVDD